MNNKGLSALWIVLIALSIIILLAIVFNKTLSSLIPISDSNKFCTDNSQCQSKVCIANLTLEQVKLVENYTEIDATGFCASKRVVLGCHPEVNNGKVSGILCRD